MPPLLPSSCLRKLNAEECDIQSLPHNLFHFNLEVINLSRNKGNDDDEDFDNDNIIDSNHDDYNDED